MLVGIFLILLMWCVPAIAAVKWLAIVGTVVGALAIVNGFIELITRSIC